MKFEWLKAIGCILLVAILFIMLLVIGSFFPQLFLDKEVLKRPPSCRLMLTKYEEILCLKEVMNNDCHHDYLH